MLSVTQMTVVVQLYNLYHLCKETYHKHKRSVRRYILISTAFTCIFAFRLALKLMLSRPTTQQKDYSYTLMYEPCKHIPAATNGVTWPEDAYVNDPDVIDVLDIANASRSRAWIEGCKNVGIGNKVRVKITLYNGRAERRNIGGDLVR